MRDNQITLRRSKRLREKTEDDLKRTESDFKKTTTEKKLKPFKNSKTILPPKFSYKKQNQLKIRRSTRLQVKTQGKITKINNQSKLKEKDEIVNWSEWVAATATKNYLLDDGFLDVIQNKSSSVIKANPDYSKDIAKVVSSTTDTKGFVPSLLSYGNFFETKVVDLLKKDLGEKNTIDIHGNARSTERYRNTIKAINDGIPVIFQGVLRNYENKTYGVADIIIRSDWINKFLDINALSFEEYSIPASKLKGKYHYVIIDIKYKCLPLRSDGIHLRNDDNLKAYKSQLCIYNEALDKIQGYLPPHAFILGSKWKYTSKSRNFEGNSCFERLGKIDFLNLDESYIEKTRLAVEWVKNIRNNEYDLSKYPLERDELYPNMCNRHDYPYHAIKKTFAENNKDLTLLWNIGPKQRRIANSKGVYTWDDEKCSPETLGVTGKVKPRILRRILEANHSETRTIYPKYIENNYSDWKNLDGRKLELFVDFETTCSVFNELDDLPENKGLSLIFLIGAGFIHPITKEWTFVKFVVDEINESEENRICKEFVSFINILSEEFEIKDGISCWHYSNAEVSSWKRFEERNKNEYSVEWSDLLKVFLLEPIGIKGCLSYGLKVITKSFYEHGFIKTHYEDSCISDGADAAVGAFKANLECKKNGVLFSQHNLTQEIVKYNEVDCKVLQEILYYLRENHVDYSVAESIDYSVEENIDEEISKRKKRKILEFSDSDF